jgi:hypothetical protein
MNLLDMFTPMLTGRQGTLAMPRMRAMGFDTDGMEQRARRAALGSLASGLLGASGWSPTPVSLGQALGQGILGAQGSYIDAIRNEIELAQMMRQEEQAFAAARREEMLEKAFSDPKVLEMLPPELRGVVPFLDNNSRVQLLGEVLKQRNKPLEPPKTREIKIGSEIVTQEFDPTTGSWRELARGARFAPPTSVNVNTTDPNALPLEIAKFEQNLAEDWEKSAKAAADAVRVHQTISTGLAANNGLGDLSAIYGFVKSLDPGSVVREGEVDLMNSAKSLIQQMKGAVDRAKAGNLFTPELRATMQQLSDQLLLVAQESYRRSEQGFQDRLNSFNRRGLNIDPAAVMSRRVSFPETQREREEAQKKQLEELLQRARGSRFGRLFLGNP